MKLKCNRAETCNVITCLHRIPHNYIKGRNHPNCTDEGVYCHTTGQVVWCKEVE